MISKTNQPTKRQQEILDFIAKYIPENHRPPTMAEIANHFGISSKNSIFRILVLLERKGFLKRIGGNYDSRNYTLANKNLQWID